MIIIMKKISRDTFEVMTTSSNENISALLPPCAVNQLVDSPHKASDAAFWLILWSAPEGTTEQTISEVYIVNSRQLMNC